MTSTNSDNGMEVQRVGDIMIPLKDYPHLPVWSSMLEAIEMMHRAELEVRGRKSLPRIILLFDLDGSISGTVRRRDLMQGLAPIFLRGQPLKHGLTFFELQVEHHLSEFSSGKEMKGIREKVEEQVTDVMRPIEQTIDFDDPIMMAVYRMVNHDLIILPVLQHGKVVGVVRTVDVFHEFAEFVL